MKKDARFQVWIREKGDYRMKKKENVALILIL